MGMTGSVLAAGGAELSEILPALWCPVGETEELGLEREMGEIKTLQVGGTACAKTWRGRRQCRDRASITGALGNRYVSGSKAPEPGM